MTWKRYADRGKRQQHDFEVKYRFLTREEGGRKTGPPYQGYRSDFLYDGDDALKDGIWMIWPEFEDSQREVILDENKQVLPEGTARMWILNDELRSQHRARIKIGSRGYFVEGPQKVAVCEITAIVGLAEIFNMDEITYLRKNRHLISKDFRDPEKLKILVRDDLETFDALDDYLTEIKDLEFTFENPSEDLWVAVFIEPSTKVIETIKEVFKEIGISWS